MGRPRKRRREDQSEKIADSSFKPNIDIDLSNAWMDLNATEDVFNFMGDQNLPPYSDAQPLNLGTEILDTSASQQFTFQPTITGVESTLSMGNECTCIQTISATLSSLQAMKTFHFPTSLWTLRNAIHGVATVIECPICPKERGSSMQNILLLQTVLTCLLERYHGLLAFIDAQAERTESVPIRIGDRSRENQHLHTFTPDCPMGVTINLEGREWRVLARKAIKDQIEGPGETLLGLMDILEARQEKWHDGPEMEKMRHFSVCNDDSNHKKKSCISHLQEIRRQASRLISD
jgi:hypothetical protein